MKQKTKLLSQYFVRLDLNNGLKTVHWYDYESECKLCQLLKCHSKIMMNFCCLFLCMCLLSFSLCFFSVCRIYFFIFLLPFRSDVRLLCSIIKREPVGCSGSHSTLFIMLLAYEQQKATDRRTQDEETARKRVHSKLPNLYDRIPSTEKCVLLE